ncbi:unnamed protein product [Arabidopsis thaliana]|uniref:ECA1-like gametogenesis related family protein n=1 Tax=Arabidopsis thaliana TaxID=3702 RepID=A0A654F334_ARATH|nr:unnamed protein product [Arabidopsis thaliana]
MKTKQLKMMFFLLILVSALINRPSEAQLKLSVCSCTQTRPIENVAGCLDSLRLAVHQDFRLLSRDCCKAVKTLPDCLFVLYPNIVYNTYIFKNFCFLKFNETKIM